MTAFHPVTIEDRGWMEPLIAQSGMHGSEYAFSNSLIYQDLYHIEAACAGQFVLIRSGKSEAEANYLFPAGPGDPRDALALCMADAAAQNRPFRMSGVPLRESRKLEEWYPGRFSFEPAREHFDYLYTPEQLIRLSGKKLQSKRNFINRFLAEQEGRWCYEPVTPDKLDECREMSGIWCEQNGCAESAGLREEQRAVQGFLERFEALELIGGILRVEGKVVAFTLGHAVTRDTFVTHVEKAYADLPGAYPMINREFAAHALSSFRYINREDDVGDEGLRRAKLSYRPAVLLEKYSVVEAKEKRPPLPWLGATPEELQERLV